MKKEIICTVCPLGCRIEVEGEKGQVTSIQGYTCDRGLRYGTDEFLHPVRILTTTVKTDDSRNPLLAVRSSRPVPKEKLMECMAEVKKITVKGQVDRYQVIVKDICGTGADLVASGHLK